MTARRYAIIGTGAIGGYYGACLQRGGAEVHFLLRKDFEEVSAQGITVKSVQGDFALPKVYAHASTATMPPVDVVVIALKTTQNHLLTRLTAADSGTRYRHPDPAKRLCPGRRLAALGRLSSDFWRLMFRLLQQNWPRHYSSPRLRPCFAGGISGRPSTGWGFFPTAGHRPGFCPTVELPSMSPPICVWPDGANWCGISPSMGFRW